MSNIHPLWSESDIEQWSPMHTAPKGPAIRVIVHGPDHEHGGRSTHELPYLLRWHGERYWAYVRNSGRVFEWHEPCGWLPAPGEWTDGRNPNLHVLEGFR